MLPSASVSFRGQWVAVVSLISDFYLLDSVGNFVDGRREEENYEENGAKNGPNGRNKGGIGQILLPSASVSFRGQWVAAVSLISDFYLLDSVGNFVGGRREEENYEENGAKNGPNGRNKGGVGQILLPSASASFRGQWDAVVSLISDFYLLDSVGNFVGGRREEENYEENGGKMV